MVRRVLAGIGTAGGAVTPSGPPCGVVGMRRASCSGTSDSRCGGRRGGGLGEGIRGVSVRVSVTESGAVSARESGGTRMTAEPGGQRALGGLYDCGDRKPSSVRHSGPHGSQSKQRPAKWSAGQSVSERKSVRSSPVPSRRRKLPVMRAISRSRWGTRGLSTSAARSRPSARV